MYLQLWCDGDHYNSHHNLFYHLHKIFHHYRNDRQNRNKMYQYRAVWRSYLPGTLYPADAFDMSIIFQYAKNVSERK